MSAPYLNSGRFGGMRVFIDRTDGRLLGSPATPPIRIRDKEKLLLGKVLQPGQERIRGRLITLLPRMERRRQAACVSDVLAQRKTSVHVERRRVWVRSRNGEIRVLVDETLGPFFERFDRVVIPPIRIIAGLIIMSASRIKSYEKKKKMSNKSPNSGILESTIPWESSWPLIAPKAPYARYNGALGP